MAHILPGNPLPPTEALVAFRLARDLGSYAAAAREENVNHATILRRVAALERWLGTKVFERTGRGISLTPAGQRFSKIADNVFEMLGGAADRWRPHPEPARISVSVLPSFARLQLLPVLPALLRSGQASPRWRVEISVSHHPVSIGDGLHDVAVRYGAGPWEGVHARALPKEELVAVAHPDLIDAEAIAPARIAELPLIHDSDADGWRRWFMAQDIQYRPKANDIRFEDYDLALNAAQLGLGALLFRRSTGPIPPQLTLLSPEIWSIAQRHWVLTAKDEARTSVISFADELHSCLQSRIQEAASLALE